jgi:hypothetical protein
MLALWRAIVPLLMVALRPVRVKSQTADGCGPTCSHCESILGHSQCLDSHIDGPSPPSPASPTPSPAVPASAVVGPWLGTDLPDTVECPIADFRAKLAAVDTECCPGAGQCSGGGSSECSLHCAGKFLPLYASCNRTMTQLLDGMDGITDGVAQNVENMRGACLALSSTAIIDEMIRMRDEDGCTIHGNGVGEQTVVTTPDGCADTDATLCGLVSTGVLSCEDDFCPGCTNAHKCDGTCSFDCAESTGGKGGGKGHRRAQIHLDDGCSPLNLEDKVGPVNDACW